MHPTVAKSRFLQATKKRLEQTKHHQMSTFKQKLLFACWGGLHGDLRGFSDGTKTSLTSEKWLSRNFSVKALLMVPLLNQKSAKIIIDRIAMSGKLPW